MMDRIVDSPYILSQTVQKFENGYGVSIVEFNSSGNKIYEIAILKYKSDELYELVYPEFTNGDIIQCICHEEVQMIVSKVNSL